MNHSGDANKMVETPRTDAHIDGLRRDPEVSGCDRTLDFARQLERELNAANDRIKRLEEAGDRMDRTAEPFVLDTIDEDIPMSKVGEQYEIIYDSPPTAGNHVAMDRARKGWRKAKEAKEAKEAKP